MKRLPALVCALFIFILLGSCGMGTDGKGTVNDTVSDGVAASSSATEDTDDAVPEDAPQTQNRQTIAVRVNLNPAEEDAMRMLADDFNASNGQGITVVVQNTYTPDEESAGADEDGDTASVSEEDASEHDGTDASVALLLDDVKAVRGAKGLQSLNERIAADYGNDPDVPSSLRGEAEKAGEQFGVPFDLDGSIFFYNASLFDDYDLAPPETWEDLLRAGEILMKEEDCPVMVTDSLTDLTDLLLRLNGSAMTDGNRAAFGTTEGEEAFTFLMEMINGDYLLLADKGTCKNLFSEERTAGYIGTGSDLADMYRNSLFEIGAVCVPHPEGKDAVCAPCTMRVLALYPGDRAQQDAAWAFVRYLTNASVTARWAVATGRFPVRAAAYLEPEYMSYTETSVAANASTGARYGYYLRGEYSEDLQYRVREIIGRNMKSNVTGREICAILVDEINDSLAGY